MCGSTSRDGGYASQSSESEHSESAECLGCGQGSSPSSRPEGGTALIGHGSALGVDLDAKCEGLEGYFGNVREWRGPGWLDPITARSVAEAGATRGFWADCDWWYGRDEKYRPIGPGLFPLATRVAARVLRLRGFGDSIVAPVATAFIRAYLEVRGEQ
jgi:hypothetical protein